MAIRLMELLIDELNLKLGDRPFYTISELVSTGIFGSKPGARALLQDGRLTYIKISPRRLVIARHVVLEFLRNNMTESSEVTCNIEIKNAVAATTATFNIADTLKRNTVSHPTMPDLGIFKKAEETETTTTTYELRPYQEECLFKHHQ